MEKDSLHQANEACLFYLPLPFSVYGPDTGLNFGSWMAYAFPISLLTLFFIWFVICMIYLGPK